ncbi:formimidoylglutamase [Photobacterium leiognathi]|uniref:formimidoylglutamase n=1 Tax=Photobacterium leiognathi TaxID=553611 RepID=UPI0029819ED4|nr:formimidoylglutamase [Photobacterium leiognathi]
MFVDQLKKLFKPNEMKPHGQHRTHTLISPYTQQRERGVVLLGVISDLSIGWNRGRQGAKEGPSSIRRILPHTHSHSKLPFYDAGDIEALNDDMNFSSLSQQQAQALSAILKAGHFPIVLGGGHEISIASYQALSDHAAEIAHTHTEWLVPETNASSAEYSSESLENTSMQPCQPRVGIINFDAHFELRPTLAVRSGSAFHTALCYSKEQHREFHYLGLGICDHANSQAMFKLAEDLGCEWLLDSQMTSRNKKAVQAKIDKYIDSVDVIHLSIGLDVFSASIAPGVNMTQMQGVGLPMVEWAIKHIMASGKVKLVDIAELNPEYDYANQTAKLAAKLVQQISRNLFQC